MFVRRKKAGFCRAAFTQDSSKQVYKRFQSNGRPFASDSGNETMAFIKAAGLCLDSIRNFVWPAYQPERHYMRGPGPACAKRQIHG